MKSIVKLTLLGSVLAVLATVGVLGYQDTARGAGDRNTLTVDVAADCRTFINGPGRAGVSYVSGKIFPAGTLPSGPATNDPTKPVNGIAPIGDWTTRGQNNFPFPPEVALSYSSTPAFFATQYALFKDGRSLTFECHAFPTAEGFCSVTGGIGAFRGAAGDTHGVPLGTNITGCPNFRSTTTFVPGSIRGGSNN